MQTLSEQTSVARIELQRFFAALQFFTRIPVPRWVGHSPELLNRAARYFPAVGLLIGAACAGVLLLAAALLPLPIAVLLSIGAGLLLTGAFHEDGLADYVDAAGGSMNRARMLEIMKDSRIGTYGTLALLLALGLKAATLFYLAAGDLWQTAAVLVTAHALSRFAGVTVMFTQTYVRDDDAARAKPVAHALTHTDVSVAALFVLPAAVLCWMAEVPWLALIVAAAVAAATRIWLGRAFVRRLGGYTGDCLGAVQQVAEIGFYLGILGAARFLH